jgi:gliding motility-associated-like protein
MKPGKFLPRDTVFCEGAELVLSSPEPDVKHSWNDGALLSEIRIDSAGEYIVTSALNTCARHDTIMVSQIDPFRETYIETAVCDGSEIELEVFRPDSEYFWTTRSESPMIYVSDGGSYSVSIKNICYEQEVTFNVMRENCDCDLFVPNIFTPNGDLKNDLFAPVIHQRVSGMAMKILNRWGTEVFNSSEAEWNGSINGSEADAGIYFWRILYGCEENAVEVLKEKKGYVHLMR